jgi:hypothetical protein
MQMEPKFRSWIESKGVTRIANKLRVTDATVRRWMTGGAPSIDNALAIVKWSRGELELKDLGYNRHVDATTPAHREAMERVAKIISGE